MGRNDAGMAQGILELWIVLLMCWAMYGLYIGARWIFRKLRKETGPATPIDPRHKLWAGVVLAAVTLYCLSNRYHFFGSGGLWYRGDKLTGETEELRQR